MAVKNGSKKALTIFDFEVTKSGEQSCEVRSENDFSLPTNQESSVTGVENPQQSEVDDHVVDDTRVLKHDIHCHLSEYRQEHETVVLQ